MDEMNNQNIENQAELEVKTELQTPEQKTKKPILKTAIMIGVGALALVAIALLLIFVVFKHNHKWSEWQISKAPTCSENGYNTRVCDGCGETQTTTIYATGHSYGEWQSEKLATCVASGIDAQYCTSCNYKNTKTTYGDHKLNSQNICSTCNKQFINMTDTEKNTANKVYYLGDRKVEYDKNNDWFKFTFALKDKDYNKLNVPTLVDIRIENDNGVVVYEKTILIKTSDYKNNLATVYIKSSEIKGDYVDDGDFYYKVYIPGYISFNELSLSVYDLPIKATTLITPSVPSTYHYYGYSASSVKITNIRYEMFGNDMRIYLSGEKIYDKNGSHYSNSCKVGYKVYDSDGYVVASGTFYSDAMCVGEKFKDDYFLACDLKIGETYTLELLDVG